MKTHIIAVMDKSSSMSRIAGEASDGFNTFIEEQRKLPGQANVTLIEFGSSVSVVRSQAPVQTFAPYRIYPSGMTALLDGIGLAINEGHARARSDGYTQTIVVIVTDGEENNSRRYNRQQIADMISECQSAGWAFVFLAANQDAFATARHFGIDDRYVANFAYDGAGAQAAMQTMSAMTSQIRGTTY